MRRHLRVRAAGIGSLAILAAPAGAAPIEFSGQASVDVGYASNPFLSTGGGSRNDGGSISVGASIQPTLTSREANATTQLSGVYSRSEYLSGGFDPSESLGVSLSRTQTFSERLNGSASLSYSNSRNSFGRFGGSGGIDPIGGVGGVGGVDGTIPIGGGGVGGIIDDIDSTTLGARRKLYAADASLQWQATQVDVISLSAGASKSEYGATGLGDYTSYDGSIAYRHVLNSQTSVGVSMGISRINSDFSGDTTTYSPRFLLDHKFNETWQFNGSLGRLIQRTTFDRPPLPSFRSTSKGIGFSANLCRTVPRSSLCISANRDTTASGLGGARTATTFGANYNYQLSERSSLYASLVAARTKAVDRSFVTPRENYYSADVGYRRQISRRFDAGVSGSYRSRDLTGSGSADGFSATLNLIARIGRLR